MTFLHRVTASAVMALVFFAVAPLLAVAQETFPTEKLSIVTSSGATHVFTVELATTDSQRQQGLMYRRSMDSDRGMLFDFREDRNVTMWMKNTFIPLDMLFISKEGKITHINRDAVPHSEAIIGSNGPVRYVLELNGGAAKSLGISVGDKVRSAQIEKNL